MRDYFHARDTFYARSIDFRNPALSGEGAKQTEESETFVRNLSRDDPCARVRGDRTRRKWRTEVADTAREDKNPGLPLTRYSRTFTLSQFRVGSNGEARSGRDRSSKHNGNGIARVQPTGRRLKNGVTEIRGEVSSARSGTN